jgi:2,4-dichlorophenol 6-monooxygenase
MSDAVEFDTDVLVVGSGPMGATTALALATYGVKAHVVNRANWLADGPRAHITNQRAVEVLRDLGIEDECATYATPWDQMGDTLFTTSLAGEEIARIRTWGTGDDRHGDYVDGSPCGLMDLPQRYLEPIIVNNAAARGASFSFNTEYLDHEQDESCVMVRLLDRLSERVYTVRCQYLVGADGARSSIVEQLGLPMEGHHGRAGTVYVQFEADLSRYVAHRPSILYWLMVPGASVGEIGMGLLRAIRPWHTWIAGWGFDVAAGEPDMSHETALRKIRTYVGDPQLMPDIQRVYTWYVNQASADVYSSGRVFCGGDAVHRHPPSSGLGNNTCLQDAFNLAWKLAYVLQGRAGPSLLDSYSAERVPVGKQVVWRANQSRIDYGPMNKAFATNGAADPVRAGLDKVGDPTREGVAGREELLHALMLKNYEFNAQGIELNQRYASSAVIPDPTVDEEVFERDPQLYLQATTRPGAKLPHAWLADADGKRISTLDVVGKGKLTLLTGLAGQAWVEATRALDLEFLRTVVIGAPVTQDAYLDWARRREIHEAGALLVRPDGYVAWRQSAPVWDVEDATRQLRESLAHVLASAEMSHARR